MNLVKSIRPLLTIFGIDNCQETAVTVTRPASPAWQPILAPTAAEIQGQPVVLSEMAKMRLAVKLANMIGNPVRSLSVIERYRRIFLIAFEPHGSIDPVMPITAVPLGETHDDHYRYLAASLQAWQPKGNPHDFAYHSNWYAGAEFTARRCAEQAALRLEPDEAEYYATQLLYSVANPDRRKLELPME